MDDSQVYKPKLRSVRFWISITSVLLASFVPQGESLSQQLEPLLVIKLTAQATGRAIESADVRGTYESLDEDGRTKANTRFRIRFAGNKFLTEMDPTKGFRYDRIVAVADKTAACEATFSDRIKPNGCHGDLWERGNIGEKARIGDGPFLYHGGETPIWLQGPLLLHHILNSVPIGAEHTKVERTDDGRYVGTYRAAHDESGQFVTVEFEVRPDFGNNLSKFGITDKRGGRTVSSIKWKKRNACWFVEEFDEKSWHQDKFRGHTRIRFSDIKLNDELPPNLFSIASLGLLEGTRILDHHPNQRASAFNYVLPKRKGDTIRVEATEQKR